MAEKNPLTGHTPFELLDGVTFTPQGARHLAIALPSWVPLPEGAELLFPAKVPVGQIKRARRALYRLCLRMDRAVRATTKKKGAARG